MRAGQVRTSENQLLDDRLRAAAIELNSDWALHTMGSFHPLLAVIMTCGGPVSLAGGDAPRLLAFVFFTAYLALAAAMDGIVLYLTQLWLTLGY